MTQHQSVIKGGWLEAKRAELVDAIPQLQGASVDVKLGVIEDLRVKLETLREWDRWDPRLVGSVVVKNRYREVDRIFAGCVVECLHALSDGRIVSGGGFRSESGQVHIWSQGSDGRWEREVLEGHTDTVHCLQALPDGRIVSGSYDSTIRVWSKASGGSWESEVLSGHSQPVSCLQVLPDGRIVSGSYDGTIRVWSKCSDGSWESEVLTGHTFLVMCLHVLPDGTIVSGSWDNTIRVWRKSSDGSWEGEVVDTTAYDVSSLQVVSDGRIVFGGSPELLGILTKGSDGKWMREESEPIRSQYELDNRATRQVCFQSLPDGRIVWSTGVNEICVWNYGSGGLLGRLWNRCFKERWEHMVLVDETGPVRCLQVLPNGSIVSGYTDGTIRVFDSTPTSGGAS